MIATTVSNSGLTQDGCPVLLRIMGPNFCKAAIAGSAPKKTMMPCAAKHHVQPAEACHGAMKNCDMISTLVKTGPRYTHWVDEC